MHSDGLRSHTGDRKKMTDTKKYRISLSLCITHIYRRKHIWSRVKLINELLKKQKSTNRKQVTSRYSYSKSMMGEDNRNWRGQWSRRAEWIDPNPTQARMGTAWLYLTVVDMQTAGTENNSRAVYVKEWIQKETKHQCRNLNRNGIYCRLIPPNATWHESYSYMKLFDFKTYSQYAFHSTSEQFISLSDMIRGRYSLYDCCLYPTWEKPVFSESPDELLSRDSHDWQIKA